MIIIIDFILNFTKVCVIVRFLTKPATLGVLFSTEVNAGLVANTRYFTLYFSNFRILICFSLTKPLALGIFLSTSLIFFSRSHLSVSYVAFKINPVVSILSTFVTNLLYSVFLITSFFTTLLGLTKPSGAGVSFGMSNLSTSGFKLARFVFGAKLLTSTCVTFLKPVFVA